MSETNARPVTSVEDILRFMLAGKAIFTLTNEVTGNRFTYKVRRCVDEQEDGPPIEKDLWFVSVLTGAEDYSYLGCIWEAKSYSHGRKSRIRNDALSAQAFGWLWRRLSGADQPSTLPASIKVYHEGRCGRCARRLTVPQSIEAGYGPECIQKMGLSYDTTPPAEPDCIAELFGQK